MPGYTLATMEGISISALEKKLHNAALSDTPSEKPPTPPPKDEPSFLSPGGVESYFNPYGHSRSNSIFSLSRASLSAQLSRLTSISLPDAASLSSSVSSIPTAIAAIRALGNAAAQIQAWIRTAAEVLGGLDAEDDVEWAAAGGRDGLGDVEAAIRKFEQLVLVYIAAVEEVQKRADITSVPKKELTLLLDTLDEVVTAWDSVNKSLKEVKRQVELAMEWEELWNVVIGEIGQEMEELGKLVFEMEERRHNVAADDLPLDDSVGVDLNELQTIVEEAPVGTNPISRINHRLSLPPPSLGGSASASLRQHSSHEDPRLLNLFARLQPLRASLDFLPMRLATFRSRAESVLPSACTELETRRESLETKYKTLESDAEILRRELGEDRWVITFRTAGRQAQKMCESVERGIEKVREALDGESHHETPATLAKKISDYEAKKNNYGPAIQKVLAVIEQGLKDRLTVNGKVLRIHADTRSHWKNIEAQIQVTDEMLKEYHASKCQQMRDSISTIVSNDISAPDSLVQTPTSSPASSVMMGPVRGKKSFPATPDLNGSDRRSSDQRSSSTHSASSSRPSTTRRSGNLPSSSSMRHLQHSSPISRLSSASPSPSSRLSSNTPTPALRARTSTSIISRPRWNSSPIVDYSKFGYHRQPPSSTPTSNARPSRNNTPSVYSYRQSRVASSTLPSPLENGRSNELAHNRSGSVSSLGTYGRGDESPSAQSIQDRSEARPRSRLYKPNYTSAARIPSTGSAKRISLLPVPSSPLVPTMVFDCQGNGDNVMDKNILASRPNLAVRPTTSMAVASDTPSGRKSSMLPMRKARVENEERKWKS